MTAFVVDRIAAANEHGRRDPSLAFQRYGESPCWFVPNQPRLAAIGFEDGFLDKALERAGLSVALKSLGHWRGTRTPPTIRTSSWRSAGEAAAMSKRILVAAHNHPSLHPGGTEIFAHDLFRAYQREGHEALFLGATNQIHRESEARHELSEHRPDGRRNPAVVRPLRPLLHEPDRPLWHRA